MRCYICDDMYSPTKWDIKEQGFICSCCELSVQQVMDEWALLDQDKTMTHWLFEDRKSEDTPTMPSVWS